MQFRLLGNSGLRVSAVGLGCMGITHASGAPMDKNAGAKVIREAYLMAGGGVALIGMMLMPLLADLLTTT